MSVEGTTYVSGSRSATGSREPPRSEKKFCQVTDFFPQHVSELDDASG